MSIRLRGLNMFHLFYFPSTHGYGFIFLRCCKITLSSLSSVLLHYHLCSKSQNRCCQVVKSRSHRCEVSAKSQSHHRCFSSKSKTPLRILATATTTSCIVARLSASTRYCEPPHNIVPPFRAIIPPFVCHSFLSVAHS